MENEMNPESPQAAVPQANIIGVPEIQKAYQTLVKYREGKKALELRVTENEEWFRLRHWECLRREKNQVEPTSGWLFNALANKHADAMDNIPTPNVLPREEGDKPEAESPGAAGLSDGDRALLQKLMRRLEQADAAREG